MDADKLAMIILLAPGAILAIALHEAMHGYAANRFGDPTAKLLGRLTLNPFKHIDPIGTIIVPAFLFYFGGFLFGWAKPVPVNLLNLGQPKRDMAFVAGAGPAANLLLAFIASGLLYLIGPLLNLGFSERVLHTVFIPLIIMLVLMLRFNIMLMLFNLIPVPPLDGGRIMTSVLPQKASEWYASIEPFGMFIIIGLLMMDSYVPLFSKTLFPVMKFFLSFMMPGYIANMGV